MKTSGRSINGQRGRTAGASLDSVGKLPVYRARIRSEHVVDIVLKSARRLAVGERIAFATLPDLMDAEAAACQKWRSGIIWRIEKGLLRLTGT